MCSIACSHTIILLFKIQNLQNHCDAIDSGCGFNSWLFRFRYKKIGCNMIANETK